MCLSSRFRPLATAVVAIALASCAATDEPSRPQPVDARAANAWLRQLVGTWDGAGDLAADPAQPRIETHATESVRALGDCWIVLDTTSVVAGHEQPSLMTLGFDPGAGEFLGTWIGGASSHLWRSKGWLDDTRTTLTIESRGPAPSGEIARFRDTIELRSPDSRVLTSFAEQPDGTWSAFATMRFRRQPSRDATRGG